MRIMLVCAGGMSTSILALRMEEYAQEIGLDYTIWATDYSTIKRYLDKVDMILIGPQIANNLAEVKRRAHDNTTVGVINSVSYGMMDGESIIQQIMKGEIQ